MRRRGFRVSGMMDGEKVVNPLCHDCVIRAPRDRSHRWMHARTNALMALTCSCQRLPSTTQTTNVARGRHVSSTATKRSHKLHSVPSAKFITFCVRAYGKSVYIELFTVTNKCKVWPGRWGGVVAWGGVGLHLARHSLCFLCRNKAKSRCRHAIFPLFYFSFSSNAEQKPRV